MDKVDGTHAWRILLDGETKSRVHAALSSDSVFSSSETVVLHISRVNPPGCWSSPARCAILKPF